MEIQPIIPYPDTIPAASGWLNFFLISGFGLHLLCMTIMIGLGLIAFYYTIKGKNEESLITKDIKTLFKLTIPYTINLGVMPFLFLQVLYGNCIYTSSILIGWYWLLIIIMLIISYYCAYLFNDKYDNNESLSKILIFISISLLLVIAFIFLNNLSMMIKPEKWLEYFKNPNGTILNLDDNSLIPRYFHLILASITNGGLFLCLIYNYKKQKGDNEANTKINIIMKWVTISIALQILSGFIYLKKLPFEVQYHFYGNNFYATHLLVLAIISTLLSFIFSIKKNVNACAISSIITLIFMVLIRDFIRKAYLNPYFSISNLIEDIQYSPMLLFFVVLTLGIIVIIYMLNILKNADWEN